MALDSGTIVRFLTITTLAGLLFSSGLRLSWADIFGSLRRCRLGWILSVNFLLVPAIVFGLARLFRVSTDTAAGMALLGAAPFAPVVPTFTRLARGDLALAGALTGLFPVLSAFVTPLICEVSLRPFLATESVKFRVAAILFVLVSTITLPLGAGVALRHLRPALAGLLLKPIQTFSEAVGAIALAYVIIAQFQFVRMIEPNELFAMLLSSELSFFLGYALSGPSRSARLVAALGTSNRNIALALLVAAQSFPGTAIAAAVVTNGLLLILAGLVHVGLWRLFVTPKIRV